MPELPEVESVRRRIEPVMRGARFVDVLLRRRDLRIPFPRRFRARLEGTDVLSLDRRAKYLVAPLSSGETLIMHLGMSGSFRFEMMGGSHHATDAAQEITHERHDHVLFRMSSGAIVTFNDPRRFGLMDLVKAGQLATHPVLSTLGPEPLDDAFDGGALALACKGKRVPLKVALLDQRVVAGLGNIYASDALHLAGLSPSRQASTLATSTGKPRPTADRLAAAIKTVLNAAIERVSSGGYRASRFRVYDRTGEPCVTPGCGGVIRQITQAGRTTFYCPNCQR
ncbi:MAG: bifunctional DNA-formamidopyrimidine glycosylase/DNA-(apurinic or apyrimidinic site) lyase [Vicinamibacterales bacterium]